MSERPFVHLHTHSCYSLLDGAMQVTTLADTCRSMGMNSLALTDHGNMFGAVAFYLAARKAAIKPILGCEVYVTTGSRDKKDKDQSAIRHLILLARNEIGYRNLITLASTAYLEGFYYKPRIDHSDLEACSEGLIGLSACLKGEIPQLLLSEKTREAEKRALYYRDLFGPGNFYMELQNHGIAEELQVLPLLSDLASRTGIPTVATNDAHYLLREHASSHEVLLSISTGKTLDETHDRLRFSSSENYFKTPDEMWELFKDHPDALEHTVEIAEKCDLTLTMNEVLLPSFPLPEGVKSLGDHLEHLTFDGARNAFGSIPEDVRERITYELNVMKNLGLEGYFLIVQDFIREARRLGIPMGPGRGSAAGSMVCYCLGITRVDPLFHELTFERFLNPERVSMPDIDLDFCQERRGEIIDHVVGKYGENHVAHIASFGTLKARAAVKDVARVMGLPFDEADSLSKMVPERGDVSLDEALESNQELRSRVEENSRYKELFKHARVLEGIARHPSTHPAGIVITPMPLQDVVPLFKPERDTSNIATTQYDMKSVEKIGLLKVDFLGLRTVTVIENCLRLIRESGKKVPDLDKLPLDDSETYALLSRGETIGLFQVESGGMTDLLRRIQPDSFKDIVAANALFRPGPMDWGNVYVECKHGRSEPAYPHPSLKPVLEETYGVLLYQEQVMKTTQVLAGFSAGQADEMRRAMSKKDPASMDLARKRFVEGALKRGVERKVAEELYTQIQKFAGYAFNKAHSVAYGLLIYQTAFLKTHFTLEFMTATLTSFMDNSDRLQPLIDECRRLGLKIRPPDVNKSVDTFAIREGEIRYALTAVKNLGRHAAESIVSEREKDGPYASIFDFARRTDSRLVSRQAMESLVKAGAFDMIHSNRAALLGIVQTAVHEGKRYKRFQDEDQLSLFGDEEKAFSVVDPEIPDEPPWNAEALLAAELEAIGLYLSGHPLDRHMWAFSSSGIRFPSELRDCTDEQAVAMGGQIARVNRISKDGSSPFCFMDIEDHTGVRFTVAAFSEVYEACHEILEPGALVAVRGRLRRRKGELQLIASSVTHLEDVGRLFRSLTITVSCEAESDTACSMLDELLTTSPGRGTVYIAIALSGGGSVVVQLRNREIQPSQELIRQLEQLPFVVGVEPGLGD